MERPGLDHLLNVAELLATQGLWVLVLGRQLARHLRHLHRQDRRFAQALDMPVEEPPDFRVPFAEEFSGHD